MCERIMLNAVGGVATIFAEPVKNCAERIQRKTVFGHQVRTEFFKIVAFKMDERAAFFALQVKMGNFFVAIFAKVFNTCGVLFAQKILLDNALRHKLFNLPVDCGDSNGNVLLQKIGMNVFRCKMAILQRFKAGKE